jgi:serine/threonine protein kinase
MKDTQVSLPSGKKITLGDNDYVISGEPIGRGASCLVYEAEKQGELGHRVIVKEFYPLDYENCIERGENGLALTFTRRLSLIEKRKEQFKCGAEEQVAFYDKDTNHRLSFPTAAEANGTAYLIVDLTHGQTLAHCSDKLSLCDIAQVMQSLCNAVSVIHESGKLYLDIKPDNIFVFDKDVAYRIGLFDFDTVIANDKAALDESLGTVSKYWSPPEQRTWKTGEIGTATDIFAIGAVFYWLISRKEPCEEWLRDVDERIQSDILKECPKLHGFNNATETARKILFATLANEVSERINDAGRLVAMAKELEKNAETSFENKPISDRIDELTATVKAQKPVQQVSKFAVINNGNVGSQKTVNIETLTGDIHL